MGRACGLSEEELDALRSGAPPALTDPNETIALLTTSSLLRSGTLDDDEYGAAVSAIGEGGLFELTTLVGYYSTLALQLRVFAGEDAGEEAGPKHRSP